MIRSDRELLGAMAGGENAAAAELWARMAPRMIGLARVILGIGGGRDDAAARDAVQGVFVRLASAGRAEAEGIRDVWAYLASATRRAAMNQGRGERRRVQRERGAARAEVMVAWDGGDPDLLDAVATAPEEDRELLALKHFAGLTFDQMALVLDEPRGTVAGRYRCALERLSVRLSGRKKEPSHV
ncbi:MAG: RNA polymerase sigma factor [Phycisphaerales bacterium]